MTLALLQREWAAAEEERGKALREVQREHQVGLRSWFLAGRGVSCLCKVYICVCASGS
jgi:hypothetical protein